jgi:hypothetical protein
VQAAAILQQEKAAVKIQVPWLERFVADKFD